MKKSTLSDIIFIPKALFKNFDNNILTLYMGILFVGAICIGFPVLENFKQFFFERPISIVSFNIIVTIFCVIMIGLVKVLFFSYPIFDFFKFLKQDKKIKTDYMFIRLMKVYIIAHFIVFLINAIIYIILLKSPELLNVNGSPLLSLIIVLFSIWFFLIITKGINVIFQFKGINRFVVFAAVFFWDSILSICLEYILNNWIFILYK